MKKRRILKAAFVAVLLFITVCLIGVTASAASEAEFKKQLAAFPESYRPYLEKLHESYPEWNFIAFETGLDWETVIDNEHNDSALVYNPDAARIFKSHDPDDYDAENDRFYYKDGSFVAASRVAVEYFMDPRNFLDIGGIFQFEVLNFSEFYTVEMVEHVLSGSFMYNEKTFWYDSYGEYHTGDITYAEAIYNAGKTYDVNPCFLASKIVNEIGSNGSGSVSGTNGSYPGIYNFYNIGATDGDGSVERGLYWASGGYEGRTTYSRPWNTPEKSIMGGAEYIAEGFIASGQFTGYLQRFNVNPDSPHGLYIHQYMSNIIGALSQGYSTYKSYRYMDMLHENLTFSIPVFENMSNEDGKQKLRGMDYNKQYGTVIVDYNYVRTGPSVDHDLLTDSSGEIIYLRSNTEVEILEKTDTDAYYHEEILAYPYWYKVSFENGGKTCTGYVPSSRISIKTGVHIAKGTANIAFAKGTGVISHIFTSDPDMVEIIDGDTVKFLKNGLVTLWFYDSSGLVDEILYKVGDYASYNASGLKATVSGRNVSGSSKKHTKAVSYAYTVCDYYGNVIKTVSSSKPSYSFKSLANGKGYSVFVRNCYGKYVYTKATAVSFVIKPVKVAGFDFTKDSSAISRLYWDKASEGTGYQVMQYNPKTDEYTKVTSLSRWKTSYTLSKTQAAKADKYAIRAYVKYNGKTAFGPMSDLISLSSKAPSPSGVKFTGKSSKGFTISWTGNSACDGYEIYISTTEKGDFKYYKTVTGKSLKISGLKALTLRRYKIRSFINTSDGKLYSDFTAPATVVTLPGTVQNLKLTPSSYSMKVSWSAVDNASYYRLYYKKGNGEYKCIKLKGTSRTLKSLSSYSDYSVYVVAVASKASVSVASKPCTTVTVKTKPAVPKKLKVTSAGYNYIDLQWNANKYLDFYKLYYMDASGKVLGSIVTKKTTARIKDLGRLTTYKFKIAGYKKAGDENISSAFSSVITSATVIPTVKNIKSSNVTESSLRLGWDKLEGATAYNVYYKKDGVFTRVNKTAKNYCTVTALPASSKGYFYITATFGTGESAIESEKSKTFTATVKPAAVTGITATVTDKSAELKWNKIKGATGYKVYLVKNGDYVYKKTVTSNSCTLDKLTACSNTTVSVVGYIASTMGTVYSDHSEFSFYTKPENITLIVQSDKTDTSYTLSWDSSSDGVNRYYLYRYNNSHKKFERIAITKKPEYTVENLTPGTTQRYTVMAALVKDGEVLSKSDKVCDFSCSTRLAKTENLTSAGATKSTIKLKWDAVEGATAYNVYYYSSEKKSFVLYKQTDKTVITVEGLKSAKKYTFRVNAVKKTKTETYTGYNSSNLSATTK